MNQSQNVLKLPKKRHLLHDLQTAIRKKSRLF
ncbi:MAG TPA: hypothetical protein DEB17_11290 [Chlorobaculum sp.]|uniref:Uncharacterized protein n=1 Tax=Chlorobaculum tepidum (strain ATCC 49652 / DSM 12025 / NBRC 103806 / TLS) TaxID=194439 RepID=Q8KCQ0_CHLTE|nr:hypothetical protein CT1363 [Chlorobaculum tepidum TLS]HBU24550.1 hypothetical protein [Chlorobaculum sp.]